MTRQNISSNTPWEEVVGYSRAVRVGNMVVVAGTVAADAEGNIQGVGDSYTQAVYIIQKIEHALKEAGSSLNDVVRTRLYVTNISHDWEGVAKAHAEFFGEVRPATTMVEVSRLIAPDYLVGDRSGGHNRGVSRQFPVVSRQFGTMDCCHPTRTLS